MTKPTSKVIQISTSDWQPIDTAPKNSQFILVYALSDFCTYCVFWDYNQWTISGSKGQKLPVTPNYWQPLPEAPKEETNETTRFEVIDSSGRVYVNNNCTIELSYQDDNRTLKVFIGGNKQ